MENMKNISVNSTGKVGYCLIKTRGETKRLPLDEITFIEQLGRKLYFHTTTDNRVMEMYEKISYAMPFLSCNFIVAGKAALNHLMIKSVTVDGKVKFTNGSFYLLNKKQTPTFRRIYEEMSRTHSCLW